MSKQQVQLKEKELLRISDLKNSDHIGFMVGSERWYIVYTYDNFHAITDDRKRSDKCTWIYNYGSKTVIDLLSGINNIQCLYRFDTRSELYQWLAEG